MRQVLIWTYQVLLLTSIIIACITIGYAFGVAGISLHSIVFGN